MPYLMNRNGSLLPAPCSIAPPQAPYYMATISVEISINGDSDENSDGDEISNGTIVGCQKIPRNQSI
jgi:hypothetical protein